MEIPTAAPAPDSADPAVRGPGAFPPTVSLAVVVGASAMLWAALTALAVAALG